jgi:RNA polymerase-binding transcription factor DksA
MRYHHLTLEQRSTLERRIRAESGTGPLLHGRLDRMRAPDFGTCIHCGGDIAYVLLEQNPAALHCRECSRLPIRRPD